MPSQKAVLIHIDKLLQDSVKDLEKALENMSTLNAKTCFALDSAFTNIFNSIALVYKLTEDD